MEETKNIVLTMQYDDSTYGMYELLSIFKAENGRDYAALLPLNEDETPRENANIELVRVKQYRNEEMQEDYLIEGIGTDAELETAKAAFENLRPAPLEEPSESGGVEMNEGLPVMTFRNGNGRMEDWIIADIFELSTRQYIALIPADESDEDNISIHLMRLQLTVQGGVEGCEVSSIPSDMEYEVAAKEFEKRLNKDD